MEFVNFSIIKNPLNWLTILLMVLIAGLAVHIIMDHAGVYPATASANG